MRFGATRALSDVDRPRLPVNRHDLSERLLILQRNVVANFDLHLLRGISIAIDDRSGGPALFAHDLSDAPREVETGDRGTLVDEVVLRHLDEPKEFPPGDVVFAPVIVEHVGEEPARLLSVVAVDPQ